MAEDDLWTERKITQNIFRAGLATRMGKSTSLNSMLMGFIFKCMLPTKLFEITDHFYHFQLMLTLQFQSLHLQFLFLSIRYLYQLGTNPIFLHMVPTSFCYVSETARFLNEFCLCLTLFTNNISRNLLYLLYQEERCKN